MTQIQQEDIQQILSTDLPWEDFFGKQTLITGATGMLASYMVFALAHLMDTRPDSHMSLVLAVHHPESACARFGDLLNIPGIQVISWDGTSALECPGRTCDELSPSFVVHAASIADSSRFLTHPVETALPNCVGTWRLLELARRAYNSRFLFFSSASAYGKVTGKTSITEVDDGHLIPSEVRSCYGESKRMGENLCSSYAAEYGVGACSVRISHTYGPTMNVHTDTRVFAEFVRDVMGGNDIVMKSDGRAMRAFCYLADACEAFFRVLLCGEAGSVYNMCNDSQFVSIASLAETIAGLFPERNLMVRHVERTADDTYSENYNANTDVFASRKLRDLGWNPTTTIEEGFRRTILSLEESCITDERTAS